MTVYAVDPGTTQSALLVLHEQVDGVARVEEAHILPNNELLVELRRLASDTDVDDVLVIEQVESMGMAVGAEVFETVHWAGRFHQAWSERADGPVVRMPRRSVKLALCGSSRAKDGNVRQALVDRFGGTTAIGSKKAPGPLYGVRTHLWAALALAVTHQLQLAGEA